MARDTLSDYPYFNEWFNIHTNASDLQLGLFIIQKGKSIAFYNRKLAYTQKIDTVTEKEMLIIVKTLKEFRTILLGQILRIYTYDKNLTQKNTEIVLRWILILEEYGSNIEYIKCERNIVAEALSRLPLNSNQKTTQESTYKK